ncbi:S8 family peptidase [Alkalimarinus sediminis]|uniref:S8 family peptidase n=1 Tax=Alkalimarinus sediminis TaxID=1632866 RepID=A0A9E8HHE2_9ALTE|nr:S8 family peptidase [Alkalimarinus sediminis]UZW74237.1 S8 family peptidase [Alkalimarinus sediminis]
MENKSEVNSKNNKPHIFLGSTGKAENYTSPSTGGGKKLAIPPQIRETHSQHLLNNLATVSASISSQKNEADSYELESKLGIQVVFESFDGVEMAIESLADARKGIELLNVKRVGEQVIATVFIPEGKLTAFETKIQDYIAHKKNKKGGPIDNQKLIDAIKSFKVAALEALWSDDELLFPQTDTENIWWEVWLPVFDDRQAVIHDFTLIATELGIEVTPYQLNFPERTVVHVHGCKQQFSSSTLLLSLVSELRLAKETAEFFDDLGITDQREWSEELILRLNVAEGDLPYVCILDTGVNPEHPLLSPFTTPGDQFVVEPTWTMSDDNGHGTEMAGLAIWGDLTDALQSSDPININHRLESVKVLRYSGDNKGKPLGLITTDGVSEAEIKNPTRNRVFSMSLASKDGRDRGRPSSWSSALDSLAADDLGDNLNPRLFSVCAGNTYDLQEDLREYPQSNELQDIHDPAQAWNVLTVGAYTNKVKITEATSYIPLAKAGSLSPHSSTSVLWDNNMPIKPEIVFEGGNVGVDNDTCFTLSSLMLLSTYSDISQRLFSSTNATSAATALAARFNAQLCSQYPDYWPETIRALTVHSANWTDEMFNLVTAEKTDKQKAKRLVRLVGYGVPSLNKALWSANNSLSLIVQDTIQPYEKKKGKQPSTKDMHIHDLPWPKDILLQLGDADVEMTVTLSYFIEPNPSSRNVSGKYSYPSHQLRFDVKRPDESTKQFKARLNLKARAEELGTTSSNGDSNWQLGNYRNKGSIHKDVWKGSAAELAERGQIAIYPAMGWWRTRTKLQHWDKQARYALIISIAAPEIDVDIYTEVLANIDTEITTSVSV